MATFGQIGAGGGSGTLVSAPPSNTKAVSSFVLDRQGTLDHLLFNFNSQAQNAKAVIYDNTGAGGLPGALVATSSLVAATGFGNVVFSFPSGPTLNPGTYWAGLMATTGGVALCNALTGGIAFNADTIAGGPSNPFGAGPSSASYRYPLVVFYTPVLPAGTAYGQLLGGDLTHQYTADSLTLLQITLPVAGKISKLTTFLQDTYAGAKCKGVIYDSSGAGGAPGALLGTTAELASPAINGNDLTFASPIAVAAGAYWIGLQTNTLLLTWHRNDSTPNYTGPASYAGGAPSTFPLTGTTANTGSWPLWATFAAGPLTAPSPNIFVVT